MAKSVVADMVQTTVLLIITEYIGTRLLEQCETRLLILQQMFWCLWESIRKDIFQVKLDEVAIRVVGVGGGGEVKETPDPSREPPENPR